MSRKKGRLYLINDDSKEQFIGYIVRFRGLPGDRRCTLLMSSFVGLKAVEAIIKAGYKITPSEFVLRVDDTNFNVTAIITNFFYAGRMNHEFSTIELAATKQIRETTAKIK